MTDEALIAQYLDGDAAALDAVVRRYTDYVYHFITQYLSLPQDAEEVTQEVFVKMWKGLKTFDRSKPFKPWLFQIARNAVVDFLRRRKHVVLTDIGDEEDSFDPPDDAPGAEERFAAVEAGETVRRAMEGLPLKYREVLLLYYEGQLNFREIAEITGDPLDTVKSRHRRALQSLRKRLAGA